RLLALARALLAEAAADFTRAGAHGRALPAALAFHLAERLFRREQVVLRCVDRAVAVAVYVGSHRHQLGARLDFLSVQSLIAVRVERLHLAFSFQSVLRRLERFELAARLALAGLALAAIRSLRESRGRKSQTDGRRECHLRYPYHRGLHELRWSLAVVRPPERDAIRMPLIARAKRRWLERSRRNVRRVMCDLRESSVYPVPMHTYSARHERRREPRRRLRRGAQPLVGQHGAKSMQTTTLTLLATAMLAVGAPLTAAAQTDEISYDYLELSYASTEADIGPGNIDGSALALEGSVEIRKHIHLAASLFRGEADDLPNTDELTKTFGIGAHFRPGDRWSPWGQIGFIDVDVDVENVNASDDGFYASGGARYVPARGYEIRAGAMYY